MTTISDQELLALNKRGIIPGPLEVETDFIKRAHFCLNLIQELVQSGESAIPLDQLNSDISKQALIPALAATEELFDIAPDWIPLIFSNENLPPWHGGCAWIFQMNDETPTAALLQLRKQFYHSDRYLRIYDRTEIIAHELTHVGRMLFEEPRFEELIAYRTSKSRFRRWLGPIVESAKESLCFVIMLGMIIMADIALIATGQHVAYEWAVWLKAVPLSFIGYGIWRLWSKHGQFNRCLQQLTAVYHNQYTAQAIVYRLTDQEIVLFARSSGDTIRQYICDHTTSSIRWQLITKAYPIPSSS